MIIEEYVTIKLAPNNIIYWRNKGYQCPAVGGRGGCNGNPSIKVKVSDLLSNSNVRVKCRCNECGILYSNRFCRNTDICGRCNSSKNKKGNKNCLGKVKYDVPSKNELIRMHFVDNMSREDIRRHFEVSRPVVERWFAKHDIIPRNDLKRHDVPSMEFLHKMHVVEKKGLVEIAKTLKTSIPLIKKWMKDYGIEIEYHRPKRRYKPSDEELCRLHFDDRKTLKEISVILNVSDVLVGTWFKEMNIDVNYYFSGTSKPESEIRDALNALGGDFVKTRKVLPDQKELDLYSEKHNLAVEYCGLYWHKNDKHRHIWKMKECRKKNITLITIFEDEWLEKPEIVLSILKSKMNINERIYGRKCVVREISKSEARIFLKSNHLQGSPSSISHSYGLFHQNDLVGCMTFGKHHRGRKIMVLNRLCFLKNCNVIGGSNKLFRRALRDIQEDIISWSDNRWSEGNVYQEMGFVKEKEYGADYSYVRGQQRFSKQSRKKSIIECPKDVKEIEYNSLLGYETIWDCGKTAWRFKYSEE